VDELELRAYAVVEVEDRGVLVANVETDDELVPLPVVTEEPTEGRAIGEIPGRHLHVGVGALDADLPAVPTGKARRNRAPQRRSIKWPIRRMRPVHASKRSDCGQRESPTTQIDH